MGKTYVYAEGRMVGWFAIALDMNTLDCLLGCRIIDFRNVEDRLRE
jgi:hypothetical protein